MKKLCFSIVLTCWLAAAAVPAANGQPLVAACNLNCGSFDAACHAQQADCQAKYMLFDAYLIQMGLGVTLYSLPTLYRELFAPHFPNADLSQVRFGFSTHQPPEIATCDCDKIYFNDASYVSELQSGTREDWFYWILHELRHYEQCIEKGSRDAFAKMWWDDLSQTDLQAFLASGDIGAVHDAMPMEADAESRGLSVQSQLEACCIHPSTGRLIRPLQVSPMSFSTNNPVVNQGLTVSVEASNGAEPYAFEWSLKRPSSSGFQTVSAASGMPNQVVLSLTQSGPHEVRVRVLQDNGSETFAPHEEIRSFDVQGPTVTALEINPNTVSSGSSTPATVHVALMAPNQSATVQLSSTYAAAVVPTTLTVAANSYGSGSETFMIETELIPATRTATIEAGLGTSTKTASLTLTAPVIQMVGIETDRVLFRGDEQFKLLLRLKEPVPAPIVVSLESSDARSITVPRQVSFEKGEREKTISLRTAREITRPTSVTLTARIENDRRNEVQTTIRVEPPSSLPVRKAGK